MITVSRASQVVEKVITVSKDNVNLKLVISFEETRLQVAPKIRS
jgi:hypothetical protein